MGRCGAGRTLVPAWWIAACRGPLLAGGILAAGLCIASPAVLAETQITVFGGANTNFSSPVRLTGPVTDTRTIDWAGDSFAMPPYWGLRGTYWLSRASSWGIALEFTHAKAMGQIDFATDGVYDKLEFSDGNNLLMLNVMYRFRPIWQGRFVPYVGIGAGVTIPHVEVTLDGVAQRTFEYQLAGAAAQGLAGLEYKLSESWSMFTEAKLSYSHIAADLDHGGGLRTYLWSPAIAVGLTYRFPSH
jgi:lipid A oxidase